MSAESVDVVRRALGHFLETGEPASGVSVEREDAMVCRVRAGRISSIDYYNNRAQALAQVGIGD